MQVSTHFKKPFNFHQIISLMLLPHKIRLENIIKYNGAPLHNIIHKHFKGKSGNTKLRCLHCMSWLTRIEIFLNYFKLSSQILLKKITVWPCSNLGNKSSSIGKKKHESTVSIIQLYNLAKLRKQKNKHTIEFF